MQDIVGVAATAFSLFVSFRARVFVVEQPEAILAAFDVPSCSALRLRSLYSDYQAQLELLLAKLTEQSGLSIDDLKRNPRDVQLEKLLGTDDFAKLKKSVLRIKTKLDRFYKAAKTRSGGSPANHSLSALKASNFAVRANEENEVVNAIFHTIQEKSTPTTTDDKSVRVQVEWNMSEHRIEELLDDIEKWIEPIKYMVANLQPALPDFDKVTTVASWLLLAPEPAAEDVPDYPESECTFVDPATMNELEASIPEIAHGRYPREKVPVQEFCPGGRYRGVCKLVIKFEHYGPKIVARGTGWLIDNNTVITAAHNLYNPSEKRHAIKVNVFVGYTGENTTALVRREGRQAQAAVVHWGYYATGQEHYDFAVLRLKSPFKDVRSIPFRATPSATQHSTKLRVVGYPGDLPEDDEKLRGHIMYRSQCRIAAYNLEDDGYQLRYLLDTYKGNSGGPVLEVAEDHTFHAIGVHCYGGATNRATAIGHQGNDVEGFQKALASQVGALEAQALGCHEYPIHNKVNGLKRITVTKP